MQAERVIQNIRGLIRSAEAPWCVKCKEKTRLVFTNGYELWRCLRCKRQFQRRLVGAEYKLRGEVFCVKCRGRMDRHGKFRGRNCWWCSTCRIYQGVGPPRRRDHTLITELIKSGESNSRVAQQVGCSTQLVETVRRRGRNNGSINCPCGSGLIGHREICWFVRSQYRKFSGRKCGNPCLRCQRHEQEFQAVQFYIASVIPSTTVSLDAPRARELAIDQSPNSLQQLLDKEALEHLIVRLTQERGISTEEAVRLVHQYVDADT